VKQGDAETCGVGRHACSAQRLKSRAQHMMMPRQPGPTREARGKSRSTPPGFCLHLSERAPLRIWTAHCSSGFAFLHYTCVCCCLLHTIYLMSTRNYNYIYIYFFVFECEKVLGAYYVLDANIRTSLINRKHVLGSFFYFSYVQYNRLPSSSQRQIKIFSKLTSRLWITFCCQAICKNKVIKVVFVFAISASVECTCI
jgi:hypothetical protein